LGLFGPGEVGEHARRLAPVRLALVVEGGDRPVALHLGHLGDSTQRGEIPGAGERVRSGRTGSGCALCQEEQDPGGERYRRPAGEGSGPHQGTPWRAWGLRFLCTARAAVVSPRLPPATRGVLFLDVW